MYSLSNLNRKKYQKHWLNYRLYSRQLIRQPMNMDIHTSRFMAAMELDEKEPLQGALADMFYGCWFDVPHFGERMLMQVKDKLNPTVLADFEKCLNGSDFIFQISPLATRWSVLVSTSMSAFNHQLRISTDDSRTVADLTISALLETLEEDDNQERDVQIEEIENEFFEHSLACNDRLAFSIVWWELAKHNWKFHEKWTQTRHVFENKVT